MMEQFNSTDVVTLDNYNYLIKYLKSNRDIILEDGTQIFLNKIKIKNYIKTLNNQFISFLRQDEIIKSLFFDTHNDNHYIFNQLNFLTALDSNEYINNSHTSYHNNIEMNWKEGNIIIDFPYKDCLLVGGMDNSEVTNSVEVFFNEVLDKNYVNKILEPKIFTGVKNYDLEKNIFEQNYIIKGNNLLGLYTLKEQFVKKIDFIYIDPPYFFDSNKPHDTFAYNSNFKLSSWLGFMKNRLEAAKELLSDNSAIFISINEHAMFELKLLCDEIFGKENFVKSIIWNKCNAQNDAKYIQDNHEYILVYTFGEIELSSLIENERKVIEKNGKFYYKKSSGLTTGGKGGFLNKRVNLGYSIYYHPISKDLIAMEDYSKELAKNSNDENLVYYEENKDYINKGYVCIRPPKSKGLLKCWTWDINKFNKDKDRISISDKGAIHVLEEIEEKDIFEKKGIKYVLVKSELPLKSIIDIPSGQGIKDLSNVSDDLKFENPKPVSLIKFLIQSFKENDAIILDFFGGSGTTAQAVLEANKEDNGTRKFILLEQMDYAKTLTANRITTFINNHSIENSFVYAELAKNSIKNDLLNCSNLQALVDIIDNNFNKGYFQNVKTLKNLKTLINEYYSSITIFQLENTKKYIIEKFFDHNLEYISIENISYTKMTHIDNIFNKHFFNLKEI